MIALDDALQQRYPDAHVDQASPQQPRWRWFARACQLKGGVPCALLIEADTGYLLLVGLRGARENRGWNRVYAVNENPRLD